MWSETYNAPIVELWHALSELFKRGRSIGTTIQFLNDSGNVVIELIIKNEDTMEVELKRSPKCNAKTFSKIKSVIEETVLKSTLSVSRSMIFSDERIQGYFRYGKEFQILPPPDDAPKTDDILGIPHPILLEFSFNKSSNEVINNYRIMKKAYELASLLNLFLNRRIWTRDFTLRKGWVYCEDERVTKLCTLLYGYKFSGRHKYADFREIKDYKPIPSVNPSNYLHPANNFYTNIDGELNVPSNLNKLLDRVFRLPEDRKEKLLKVAKSFSLASKLWDVSETAAYLATVNTIESIVTPSSKERCEACKKLLEGPTKSFKKFMDEYISKYDDNFIKKVKNKIYKTRSGITHKGILFGEEDRNPYWYQPSLDKYLEGHILRCLAREAIINWFTDVEKIQ